MLRGSLFAISVAACSSITWKTKSILAAQANPEYELCLVQVVFRHGARTPVEVPSYVPVTTYDTSLLEHSPRASVNYRLRSLDGGNPPTDSTKDLYVKGDVLEGGCSRGALTRIGANQMHNLGKYLRKQYLEGQTFLSTGSLAESVYTRSTCTSRTIMSARSVLASESHGLFDGATADPLDIFTTSNEREILSVNFHSCRYLQRMIQSQVKPTGIPEMETTAAAIRKALHVPPEVRLDFVLLRDHLEVEAAHGMSNLKHALNDDELVKNIQRIAVSIVDNFTMSKGGSILSMSIGLFLDLLLQNMDRIKNGQESDKKMHLYSSHDITVFQLLRALQIKNSEWPTYGSNVILELFRRKNSGSAKYFVRVLCNGVVQPIGQDESTLCPLEDFVLLLNPFRVSQEEYEKLCFQD